MRRNRKELRVLLINVITLFEECYRQANNFYWVNNLLFISLFSHMVLIFIKHSVSTRISSFPNASFAEQRSSRFRCSQSTSPKRFTYEFRGMSSIDAFVVDGLIKQTLCTLCLLRLLVSLKIVQLSCDFITEMNKFQRLISGNSRLLFYKFDIGARLINILFLDGVFL